MSKKIIIPKEKIGGLRFGQLIWSALADSTRKRNEWGITTDEEVGNLLDRIPNSRLQKLIDKYLKGLK